MEWYYLVGEAQLGPVSSEDLKSLLDSGEITAETYVWRDSMPDWQPFSQVELPAMASAETPEPEADEMVVCAISGQSVLKSKAVQRGSKWVLKEFKDVNSLKLDDPVEEKTSTESAASDEGDHAYAGVLIRFVARLIDGILLAIVLGFCFFVMFALVGSIGTAGDSEELMDQLGLPLFIMFNVVPLIIVTLYETLMVGQFQATLGKIVCGIKVVRPDGTPLTHMRALARCWGNLLSSFTFYIGYIIAIFDAKKRTLHDYLCDTRVVGR